MMYEEGTVIAIFITFDTNCSSGCLGLQVASIVDQYGFQATWLSN